VANEFVSWLDHAASKVGSAIEDAAQFTVKDILPEASKALEVAAPVVSLAFPIEGATLAKIAGYIVSAQQKFPTPQSGEAKLAYVTQLAEAELLPLAQQAGLDSATTTAAITKYLNALVALVDGPTVTTKA
jgi:hypothetical protein